MEVVADPFSELKKKIMSLFNIPWYTAGGSFEFIYSTKHMSDILYY